MVLGTLLSFLFLFLLFRLTQDQLYRQNCGIIASFHETHVFNSSSHGFPSDIAFTSEFPVGTLNFRGVHVDLAELSITRFACVSRVLQDETFTGVSFSEEKTRWTASVRSDADAVAIYDRKSLSGSYNAACVNEISTLTLP